MSILSASKKTYKGTPIKRENGSIMFVDKVGDIWWFKDEGSRTFNWYIRYGQEHRIDGPALIVRGCHTWNQDCENREYWFIGGKLHREDGPAYINYTGHIMRYYVHGNELTPIEFENWLAMTRITKQGSKKAGVNLDV